MKNNGARWLFVLACVLALGAVVQDYRFDSSSRQRQAAAQAFEREVSALRTTVAELRGGQTAYLATGQGPEFWMRRVTELATQVESGLARLQHQATNSVAQSQLATASTALTDLLAVDKRARQALDGEQRFLAADIVLAEGRDATQTLGDALASSAVAEISATDAILTRDARIRLALMPVALLIVVAAAIVLASQTPRPASPASAAAAMAQMLRELPPPVKTTPTQAVVPAPVAVPKPIAAPVPAVDLAEAAELCVDLARVMDVQDLPTLLARAAKTLDATGVVIWVITQDGDRLMPVLSHGYSQKVMERFGSLDATADNMTSVCYQTMRPQSMPGVGQPGATSAIAVPLVTTEGCNGVMAAELQVIKPAAESVAIARIIAAQFATMINPCDVSSENVRAAKA